MPKVCLQKDEHDENMVRIYSIIESQVWDYKRKRWILSGAMHIDDVDGVFGSDIAHEVQEMDHIDVNVIAEIDQIEQ